MISDLRRGRSAPLGASADADGVDLDVVFNHTAEGDDRRPTFRGLENEAYYFLEDDRSRYGNYTGTGNTLDANHAVVRRLIRESLRYWVEHMHVDGFRFDVASILSREQSVNFVTCHDGFTLQDLVSYDAKHNEANGEENRDGADDNAGWNCGAEGPTDDPDVEALRSPQIRNFPSLLLLAVGTPMLTMGDEIRRTQRGNDNAYCQDDDVSWLDWTLLERNRDVHRLVKSLIALRMQRDVVADCARLNLNQLMSRARIDWHGVDVGRLDWRDCSHSLAFTITSLRGHLRLHAMLNAYWEPLRFELPPPADGGSAWLRWIDTSLASPDDIVPWEKSPAVAEDHDLVQPRSLAFLVPPTTGGEP